MKNITQNDIRELQIPFPPLETQQNIVDLIQRVTQARLSVVAHLKQTILLRRMLLHRLLVQ